jgi:cytochrome c oxidase cbb3-type subunit 4
MNFTLIQSIWSIVVLVTFIGIVLWAYSSKRKSAFDEAAHLPFDDEPPRASNDTSPPKKPARSR